MHDESILQEKNARLTEILLSILEVRDINIPLNLLKRAQGAVAARTLKRSKITDKEVRIVRKMRAEGKRSSEIAIALDRSYSAVSHIIFKYKIPVPVDRKPGHITQRHIDDALMMRSKGYTWIECGDALNRHWQVLGNACRAYDKEACKRGVAT